MNGDLFKRAAQALYPDLGDEWHSAFGRRFQVSESTIRRFQRDQQPVPPGLRHDIYKALCEYNQVMSGVLGEIVAEMETDDPR